MWLLAAISSPTAPVGTARDDLVVSFAPLSESPLANLIEASSEADKLRLRVGTGAAMEAGLPSWALLLDRLLLRAGRQRRLIDLRALPPEERVAAVAASLESVQP